MGVDGETMSKKARDPETKYHQHERLVRLVLHRLAEIRDVWCWAIVPYDHMSGRRTGPRGIPDIIGVARGGRFIGFEIKTGSGRLSESQRNWHRIAGEYGVGVFVIRGLDDLEQALATMGIRTEVRSDP